MPAAIMEWRFPLPQASVFSGDTPDAIIAGTLCLMSCYVQNPVAIYAERIGQNLQRMSALDNMSAEMRTICRRLAERWERILVDTRQRATSGASVVDRRAIH